MLATALADSGIRNAFFGKISRSARVPDVSLLPQSAENTRQ
jgi:hypothetical protein